MIRYQTFPRYRINWTPVVLGAAALALLAVTVKAGAPRRSEKPLKIEHNGVHAPYNLRNKHGELILYNFRAVEPKVLYRGSGFPRNRKGKLGDKVGTHPAAFFDSRIFDFFRSKNIRLIVTLQERGTYYGERGYFKYWGGKTGYKIRVESLPIRIGHAYDLDARKLLRYPPEERLFGLSAAAEFIEMMKKWNPRHGAVYLHCDAGKDRTGVVAAAYEMWRNQGHVDNDKLWQQVMKRYLVSNVVIARDKEAAKFAGGKVACGKGEEPGFVCRNWLEPLRPHLERIAQL